MDKAVFLLQGAAVAVFAVAMIWAAASDLRRFEVPNWVSVAVVVSFLAIASGSPAPWSGMLGNVVTGFAVLCVGFALFAARLLGAGDAKLLAAIALWVGWPLLIPYLFYVVLAGGLLALILILFRRYPLHPRLASIPWMDRMHARKKDMPYAVPIALTAMFFVPVMPVAAPVFAG